MIIKNVSLDEYNSFLTKLESNKPFHYPNTIINDKMSSSMKSYRYNMNFGYGEGGIRVDYWHNTLPSDASVGDLRIEFNPNKFSYTEYDYEVNYESGMVLKHSKPYEMFFKILNTHFDRRGTKNALTGESKGHVRVIREFDIAYDFNIDKKNIMIASLTGKEHSNYKGTLYWGNKHTHGYLKCYDKKKERKDDKAYEKYEHLTRIEYTFRFEGNIGVNEISRIEDFEMDKQYTISIYDDLMLQTIDPTVKAYLLCYMNGLMEMKEFSRRYKEKVKDALKQMNLINLNSLTKRHQKQILNSISKYIRL